MKNIRFGIQNNVLNRFFLIKKSFKYVFMSGLIVLLTQISWGANSNKVKSSEAMTASEASVSSVLLQQLLNSVEKASLDFEVEGLIDSDKGFLSDSMKLSGLSEFNSDWQAAIRVPQKEGESTSPQIEKLIPIVKMDAKNLVASINLDQSKNQTKMELEFYGRYDQKKKKWTPRPLLVTISNQLNKALIKIKFNWVKLEIIDDMDPQKPKHVKGTCSSEKSLLDFTTGLNVSAPVQCEFDGTFSDAGYNIHFKYVNAKPHSGT